MTETITGITEEELAALTAGEWFDDDSVTPGWKRWVKDSEGEEFRQSVFPSLIRPGWRAHYGMWRSASADRLGEALTWCDSQVGDSEIVSAEGRATRQERRFAEWPPAGNDSI